MARLLGFVRKLLLHFKTREPAMSRTFGCDTEISTCVPTRQAVLPTKHVKHGDPTLQRPRGGAKPLFVAS